MTPRKLLRFVILPILLFALTNIGCKPAPPTPAKITERRLAWNLKTTVEAYDVIGVTSPKWDEPARRALTEFAHARAQVVSADEPWGEIISTNVAAAVNAGCDDPLVTYLYIRFALPQSNSKVEFAKRYYKTAKAMNESLYPPVRKFYATARAMDQYYYTYDTKSNLQANAEVFELLGVLYQNVTDTMADKTIPSEEALEINEQAMHLGSGDANNEDLFYNAIEQPLSKNLANDYLPWYLKGNHYLSLAWRARGNGYADKVTSQGWKDFSTNLVVAREAFEHAWKLNPQKAIIAEQMISVAMGAQSGREDMELWFKRAMDANTNDFEACRRKLFYLEPEWYGSDEEELLFGQECVESEKWGGSVPMILLEARRYINGRNPVAEQSAYWKKPEVWADIQKSFERFIEINPDDTSRFEDYVWYAYHAEQWDKLNELLPKLGTTNYGYFGGKAEFDKMARLANEHK